MSDAATEDGPPQRVRRATALGRGTQGVPELRRLVEGHLHAGFPHRIWVSGRVGSTGLDAAGDLRFALHASSGDEPFAVPCTVPAGTLPHLTENLDRLHDADVGNVVTQGRLARAGGLLRYDFVRNSLVFVVSELDPAPTALGLEEDRAAARERAREHGLRDRQRVRTCRTAPLRVALVGPVGDAAVAGVGERLAGSGFDVDLLQLPVETDGPGGPVALSRAVRDAGLRADLVLLLRGPGRPLGLGVYDSDEVAAAVAAVPVPVLVALSTPGTETVCDAVAFASLTSADDVVQWVLARLGAAEQALDELRAGVEQDAEAAADRARHDLDEVRADLDRTVAEAQVRATGARRRLTVRVLVAAALVAVALVMVALLADAPLVLLGLPVVAAALFGAHLWSRRALTRGSRPVSTQDDEFTAVLARLREVRADLAATSSPEAVHRLRDVAAQLVARGEAILGRELDRRV